VAQVSLIYKPIYRAYTKEWCGFNSIHYWNRTILLCTPCIYHLDKLWFFYVTCRCLSMTSNYLFINYYKLLIMKYKLLCFESCWTVPLTFQWRTYISLNTNVFIKWYIMWCFSHMGLWSYLSSVLICIQRLCDNICTYVICISLYPSWATYLDVILCCHHI
jgi:hypothetical protein